MTEILLTAGEAYPAFERIVRAARDEVVISMRIFDVATRLFGETDLGETWADLIAAKLAEGVRFDITIADFDPVARPAMHQYSWDCRARLKEAAKANPENLTARVLLHPARVSWIHRLSLRPVSKAKLVEECERLNDLPKADRDAQLELMPGFCKLVVRGKTLRPKRWPPPPLVPATHHQKLAVVDGEVLYIGGLDLNPRRYDTTNHDRSADDTWHDVQVIVRDERAQSALVHLREFARSCAGAKPKATPGVLRTLSCRDNSFARPLSPKEVLTELEDAHVAMIQNAREFIYIETQFLRSSVIADALVDAAQNGIEVILLLPSAPEEIAFDQSRSLDSRYGEKLQADALDRLRKAYGERLFVGSPARPVAADGDRDTLYGAEIIYIHAKVMIADGTSALVSSANLNGRSMRWDTEAGVTLNDVESTELWQRSIAHWFRGAAPGKMTRASEWTQAAHENQQKPPQERPHFVLPHDNKPARETGVGIPGFPEELV